MKKFRWIQPALGLLMMIAISIVVVNPDLVFAASASRKSSPATPAETLAYLRTHSKTMNRSQMDYWVLKLIEQENRAKSRLEQQLFSNDLNPVINRYPVDDLINMRNIKEPKIAALIQKVHANGFKLSTSEGMIYIEIDYPRLFSDYGRQASPQVHDYLNIMAAETRRHFSEDAGLVISPDQLAERIVSIERFILRYPGFTRMTDITPLYRNYQTAYLIGMNNTPAFSYQTHRLTAEFLKSFHRTVSRYPRTHLAQTIRDYLKLLEREGYGETKRVLEFAGKHID